MRLSAILAAFVLLFALSAQATEPAPESAYDRVMRTGMLRCGYINIPPELSRDMSTGKMTGLAADVMEDIGTRLGLKIEWTAEVSFPDMGAGLASGKFDAVCFTLYRLAGTARAMNYTTPLFYSQTGIYVRADDTRFDGDISKINSPDITIATIDGEMAAIIAREQFPQAKTLSMPQLTDLSQMMLAVATGKADVAFQNGVVASPYLKANPGQLREVPLAAPLRVFSHGLAFGKHDYALGEMLNAAIEEMRDQGVLARLLAKHEPLPGSYLRVTRSYEQPAR